MNNEIKNGIDELSIPKYVEDADNFLAENYKPEYTESIDSIISDIVKSEEFIQKCVEKGVPREVIEAMNIITDYANESE